MTSEKSLRKYTQHIEKWKPIIPTVSDKLLPIVDKMFHREAEMLETGLTFYQLDQELLASLCENESEVEEHKQDVTAIKIAKSSNFNLCPLHSMSWDSSI